MFRSKVIFFRFFAGREELVVKVDLMDETDVGPSFPSNAGSGGRFNLIIRQEVADLLNPSIVIQCPSAPGFEMWGDCLVPLKFVLIPFHPWR